MRPVESGKMVIKGLNIRIGNLIYFNEVDSRGIGTLYKYIKRNNKNIFNQFYEKYDINLKEVIIAESVPLIVIR